MGKPQNGRPARPRCFGQSGRLFPARRCGVSWGRVTRVLSRLASLSRRASNVSMQEAGRLIEIVQVPIGTAVEDFGSPKLVLPDLSIREECFCCCMRHTRIVSPLLTCLRPLREGLPAGPASSPTDVDGEVAGWGLEDRLPLNAQGCQRRLGCRQARRLECLVSSRRRIRLARAPVRLGQTATSGGNDGVIRADGPELQT